MNLNTNDLSKQYKMPQSVIEFEYAKIVETLSDNGATGEDLTNDAEELIHAVLRRITSKSKADMFTGMVLAVDRIKDNSVPFGKPSKRQTQVNAYIANPEEAVATGKVAVIKTDEAGATFRTMLSKKTGLVVEEQFNLDIWKDYQYKVNDLYVVPLDDMKVWHPSGKENFSYLHNLPLHAYRTSIMVVLKTTEGYQLSELDYQSERYPGNIPMYTTVNFAANVKESKNNLVQLASTKFTTFEPSDEVFGKTPLELITTLLTGIKFKLDKLEAYHTQMVKSGKQWDAIVMVEAFVREIRELDNGNKYITIDDLTGPANEPTKVWLHDGIDVNFGVSSKVWIIGKTSQGDKYDSATKTKLRGVPGDITINSMGIYTKFNTTPTNLKPVTDINL